MKINERLKYLRKEELKLTQEEISKKINIGRANYGNMETGVINITPRNIMAICNTFNVNENWLVNGVYPIFIRKSREEEIAIYLGKVLSPNNDNDFMKKFIHMLSRLDVEEWEIIEKMAIMLANENE